MTPKEVTDRYLEIRGCKIKRSYRNRAQAKAVAKEMNRKSETGRLRAYSCHYCNSYHVGHVRIPKKEQIQERRNLKLLKNAY